MDWFLYDIGLRHERVKLFAGIFDSGVISTDMKVDHKTAL